MAALLEVRLPLRFVLGTWDPRVFTRHTQRSRFRFRPSVRYTKWRDPF